MVRPNPIERPAVERVTAVRLAATRLPLLLARTHRSLPVGSELVLRVGTGWRPGRLRDVLEGAGFALRSARAGAAPSTEVRATRERTLPDTVGPGMRVLVVGLNPSLYAADAGHGFARPGNRFWPAALAAGLVSRAHDPYHALEVDGVGMTDLVKRATRRAGELAVAEFDAGAARVARLVSWLRPETVCVVGLSGYRAAVDRRATSGWQGTGFAGRPTYVMPNTSGINAHASLERLTAHLAEVATGA